MSHPLDQGAQIAVCPVLWALTDKELAASIAAMIATTVPNKMMRFKAPLLSRTTNQLLYFSKHHTCLKGQVHLLKKLSLLVHNIWA
jgi:hypothetical protein